MELDDKDEASLLLYLETRAVDHDGKVELQHMNAADQKTATRWNKQRFIFYGRLPANYIRSRKTQCTHYVVLSDEAWAEAARLRRERGLQGVIRGRNEGYIWQE